MKDKQRLCGPDWIKTKLNDDDGRPVALRQVVVAVALVLLTYYYIAELNNGRTIGHESIGRNQLDERFYSVTNEENTDTRRDRERENDC